MIHLVASSSLGGMQLMFSIKLSNKSKILEI